MDFRNVFIIFCAVLTFATQSAAKGTWETTLLPRDLDGDSIPDAYFDTDLNVTWLKAGNLSDTYYERVIESINGINLYGYSDWRLPKMFDIGLPGCEFGGPECGYSVVLSSEQGFNEMAHLYYKTLGNLGRCRQNATDCEQEYLPINYGPFVRIIEHYWYSTPYLGTNIGDPEGAAWFFDFDDGYQNGTGLGLYKQQLALRDGDTAPVPEPGTVLLMLLGTIALVAAKRRTIGGPGRSGQCRQS